MNNGDDFVQFNAMRWSSDTKNSNSTLRDEVPRQTTPTQPPRDEVPGQTTPTQPPRDEVPAISSVLFPYNKIKSEPPGSAHIGMGGISEGSDFDEVLILFSVCNRHATKVLKL